MVGVQHAVRLARLLVYEEGALIDSEEGIYAITFFSSFHVLAIADFAGVGEGSLPRLESGDCQEPMGDDLSCWNTRQYSDLIQRSYSTLHMQDPAVYSKRTWLSQLT